MEEGTEALPEVKTVAEGEDDLLDDEDSKFLDEFLVELIEMLDDSEVLLVGDNVDVLSEV